MNAGFIMKGALSMMINLGKDCFYLAIISSLSEILKMIWQMDRDSIYELMVLLSKVYGPKINLLEYWTNESVFLHN